MVFQQGVVSPYVAPTMTTAWWTDGTDGGLFQVSRSANMSWTTYTDSLVENKVELCAIHGKNGAPWAQVPGFTCTPDEVLNVANAIASNDNGIYGSGALMGGKRWTVIRLETDASLIVFKGKDQDNMKQTLVVALSTQAVIIGANKDENVQGAAVRTAVEGLRDYLKQCGY